MLRPNPRQRVQPNAGPGDFGAYGAGRLNSRKEAGSYGSLRVLCETGAAVDVTTLSAELEELGRVHPELAGQLTLAATTIDEQKKELGGMLGEMAKVKAWGSRPPWSSRPVDLRLACCLKWPDSGVLSAVCCLRWALGGGGGGRLALCALAFVCPSPTAPLSPQCYMWQCECEWQPSNEHRRAKR